MTHGPVMLDLNGLQVSNDEKQLLRHPATGGVILFSRNFESTAQLTALIKQIHALRSPELLVAVDQEGGRVQRFREGFSRLPAARRYGELYDLDHQKALKLTSETAWLMAAELRSTGVDFSFAPVLDLNTGISNVIGDRAFHRKPEVISQLTHAWMKGCHEAGMSVVAKHFPGHGSVAADSHTDLPIDSRNYSEIEKNDLLPFRNLVEYGLDAVMPAHVIYDQVNSELAGFSRFWLQDILREKLRFQGVIFSDDITMAAAENAGNPVQRAELALEAGCDMILVCNDQSAAEKVLESLENHSDPVSQSRLARMHGHKQFSMEKLRLQSRWKNAVHHLHKLNREESLNLELEDPTVPRN